MAWLNKRIAENGTVKWRLLERINKKTTVVVNNLGSYKALAETSKVNYKKALAMGFIFTPPITVADIEEFLKAKAEGKEHGNEARRISIEELCDLWLKYYGPSLKGGVEGEPYYCLKTRVWQLKEAWAGRWADSITLYDVRDLLEGRKQPGTKLRWIGSFGAMFKGAAKWNTLGNVLPYKIRLPDYNPFKEWRAQMPAAHKLELPDERVLEPDEWDKFKVRLTPRARAICEMILRRFLRLADIKKLSQLSQRNSHLQGVQEKTGSPFLVPLIHEAPAQYDFTNFLGDFENAQIAAEMDLPADHPLHFSPKDLRRTGATWAWRAGEDIVKISAMLGHKKLSTTQRYLRIRLHDVQSVADAVDKMANRTLQVIAK